MQKRSKMSSKVTQHDPKQGKMTQNKPRRKADEVQTDKNKTKNDLKQAKTSHNYSVVKGHFWQKQLFEPKHTKKTQNQQRGSKMRPKLRQSNPKRVKTTQNETQIDPKRPKIGQNNPNWGHNWHIYPKSTKTSQNEKSIAKITKNETQTNSDQPKASQNSQKYT